MSFYPTEQEKESIRVMIDGLIDLLRRELERRGVRFYKIVPGGSTARGTFLHGDHDIDIFIVTSEPDRAIRIVRELFPRGVEKKGELEIWNTRVDDYNIDIVAVNPETVERWFTLEHTEIYSKMSNEQKRIAIALKALFKTWCAYGAENGGISGVAVEELVRRFTEPGDTVDRGIVKVCEQIVTHEEPFWLQDPAAERHGIPRNLLASVVEEKWRLLQKACIEYFNTHQIPYTPPGAEKYRFIRESEGWKTIQLESTGNRHLDFHKTRSICITYCNRLRNSEKDVQECICDSYSDGKKVIVAVKVPEQLPPYRTVCIEPWKIGREAVEKFIEKHPDYYIDNYGRICTTVPRKITRPFEYIKQNIEKEWERYLKEKTRHS